MSNKSYIRYLFILFVFFAFSCNHQNTPKPHSYFRIDLPEKKYQEYSSRCPYTFEYPVYGSVENYNGPNAQPCWINIVFPAYKAEIHLTYKTIENNLSKYVDDVHTIAYKHSIKADDIIEKRISYPETHVYGILYDITGNAASSVNFFVTDSVEHFLNGSLYFNVSPNADSLAPLINFFRKDIMHLLKTLEWKNAGL